MLRRYISRVENGHTVPSVETLEKLARALAVPLYQLFYEGEEPPKLPNFVKRKAPHDIAWGSGGKPASYLHKLRKCLGQAQESENRWSRPPHRYQDARRSPRDSFLRPASKRGSAAPRHQFIRNRVRHPASGAPEPVARRS